MSEESGQGTIVFKCVMLGPPGVGKTCLLNRLAKGQFLDSPLSTLSSASLQTSLPLPDGAMATMDLWDTGGQERYRSLTASYYRDAKAVLLVYDAEHKHKIVDWMAEAQYHLAQHEALVFLVGTKLDLGSDVMLTEEEVQTLAQLGKGGVGVEGHFALSSKSGQNVDETFLQLAESVWRAGKEKRVDLRGRQGTLRVSKEAAAQRSTKSGCCARKRDAGQQRGRRTTLH